MNHQQGKRQSNSVNPPLYKYQNPQPSAALETWLIFVALLIAVTAALYVLEGQIARIV